jgi:hypothetical protein
MVRIPICILGAWYHAVRRELAVGSRAGRGIAGKCLCLERWSFQAGSGIAANSKGSKVWESTANNNLVKTGATDVNSVRAAVKNGTIAVIVNGRRSTASAPKSRAAISSSGSMWHTTKASATPVLLPVCSYKETAVE